MTEKGKGGREGRVERVNSMNYKLQHQLTNVKKLHYITKSIVFYAKRAYSHLFSINLNLCISGCG